MGLTFDGSGDWSVFETTLEGHRAFYNLSGQEMKYILSFIIKGKAGVFLHKLMKGSEVIGYENFMINLRENYASVSSASSAYLELRQTKQRDGETVREYEARL